MRARRLLGTAAALLMAGMATSACAQPAPPAAIREPVSETGTAGGAPYRIDVPAPWNGGLVVFYHGYEWPAKGGPTPIAACRARSSCCSAAMP